MHKLKHMKFVTTLLAALLLWPALTLGQTPKLNLKCEHYSTGELRKRQQIERLAAQYDLTKYTITRDILIEGRGVNHALPTLTLNLVFLDNDDRALGVYVHEQAHRLLHDQYPAKARAMVPELKRIYPDLKFETADGDPSERASWGHLPVLMLEWQALEDLIGVERAQSVMKYGRQHNYKELFATVIDNRKQMEEFLKQYEVKW
jgi:hypothetical protein